MKLAIKGAAEALAAFIILTLGGCGEIRLAEPMKENVVISINNEECTIGEAVFRLMEVKDQYDTEEELFWERSIGDITIDQYIKDGVLEEVKKYTASVLMAEEMALYLDEEDKAAAAAKAKEAYTEVGKKHDLSQYGITLETCVALYEKRALYDKVFDRLTENINLEISESDTKVIEINYVEIPLKMSMNTIEDIRYEIKSGTSFERACQAQGLEPVLNKQLVRGEMPTAFDNVAYMLTDGELSEVVETSSCNYLIQCIEDYLINESVANNNKVISEARQELFFNQYNALAGKVMLRFNEELWDSVDVRTI